MKLSDIAVSVDHLEDDLLKVRDLAMILNDQMIRREGMPVTLQNALSHLTIEIVDAAERMRGHVSDAFEVARAQKP